MYRIVYQGGIWCVQNWNGKSWFQFLNTTEEWGTKIPDCGTTSIETVNGGCYFLWTSLVVCC